MTKLQEEIKKLKLREASELSVLIVDPASGAKSYPGYCLLDIEPKTGKTEITSGILHNFKKSWPMRDRLLAIYEELLILGQGCNVVAIEDVPPYMVRAGTDFKNKAVLSLHKSIGIIELAAAKIGSDVLFIAIPSWQAFAKKKYKDVIKTDANDAQLMGLFLVSELLQPSIEMKLSKNLSWKEAERKTQRRFLVTSLMRKKEKDKHKYLERFKRSGMISMCVS